MHTMTKLVIWTFFHIPEAIFNATTFQFDTNVVVSVTLAEVPGFVRFMDL